jgi:hypothetical protein
LYFLQTQSQNFTDKGCTQEASALEFDWDIKPFQNGFFFGTVNKMFIYEPKIWSAFTEDKNTQMLQKDIR